MIDEFVAKLKEKYEPILGQQFREQKAKARRTRTLIIGLIIFAICGMLIMPEILFIIGPLMIIIGIVLIISSIIKNQANYNNPDTYERRYNENIGKEILGLYYTEPSFYYPRSFQEAYLYKQIGYERYDQSSCDFEMNFKYKDRVIKASSILLEDVSTDSDGNTTTTTVFRGLFCRLDLGYDVGTKICIAADALRFGTMKCNEKVKMDSKRFESCFDIYTNDKIKAMQLLTADVMEKLADLFHNSEDGFDVVIDGNTMYIRVSLRGDMFAINYFGDLLDKKSITRDILALGTISNVIDVIDYGVESNHLI